MKNINETTTIKEVLNLGELNLILKGESHFTTLKTNFKGNDFINKKEQQIGSVCFIPNINGGDKGTIQLNFEFKNLSCRDSYLKIILDVKNMELPKAIITKDFFNNKEDNIWNINKFDEIFKTNQDKLNLIQFKKGITTIIYASIDENNKTYFNITEDENNDGEVIVDGLKVHKDKGCSSKNIGYLKKYDEIKILKEEDGWYQIEFTMQGNKTYGWCVGNYIKKLNEKYNESLFNDPHIISLSKPCSQEDLTDESIN